MPVQGIGSISILVLVFATQVFGVVANLRIHLIAGLQMTMKIGEYITWYDLTQSCVNVIAVTCVRYCPIS